MRDYLKGSIIKFKLNLKRFRKQMWMNMYHCVQLANLTLVSILYFSNLLSFFFINLDLSHKNNDRYFVAHFMKCITEI